MLLVSHETIASKHPDAVRTRMAFANAIAPSAQSGLISFMPSMNGFAFVMKSPRYVPIAGRPAQIPSERPPIIFPTKEPTPYAILFSIAIPLSIFFSIPGLLSQIAPNPIIIAVTNPNTTTNAARPIPIPAAEAPASSRSTHAPDIDKASIDNALAALRASFVSSVSFATAITHAANAAITSVIAIIVNSDFSELAASCEIMINPPNRAIIPPIAREALTSDSSSINDKAANAIAMPVTAIVKTINVFVASPASFEAAINPPNNIISTEMAPRAITNPDGSNLLITNMAAERRTIDAPIPANINPALAALSPANIDNATRGANAAKIRLTVTNAINVSSGDILLIIFMAAAIASKPTDIPKMYLPARTAYCPASFDANITNASMPINENITTRLSIMA